MISAARRPPELYCLALVSNTYVKLVLEKLQQTAAAPVIT
jgi:hypothetical protein